MAQVRVAGVAYVKRDGVQYSLKGTLTIQPNETQKESVVGQDGVHGYKESFVAPSISAQVTKTPDLSLKALEGVTNSTITAECADGTTYVLSNAFFSGLAELDAGEGQVTIKFEGMSCNEI